MKKQIKVRAGNVVDEICRKVGILNRDKPGSTVLSKRELVSVNTYLDVLLNSTKSL